MAVFSSVFCENEKKGKMNRQVKAADSRLIIQVLFLKSNRFMKYWRMWVGIAFNGVCNKNVGQVSCFSRERVIEPSSFAPSDGFDNQAPLGFRPIILLGAQLKLNLNTGVAIMINSGEGLKL